MSHAVAARTPICLDIRCRCLFPKSRDETSHQHTEGAELALEWRRCGYFRRMFESGMREASEQQARHVRLQCPDQIAVPVAGHDNSGPENSSACLFTSSLNLSTHTHTHTHTHRRIGCLWPDQAGILGTYDWSDSPAQVKITDVSYPVMMALLDHLYSDTLEVGHAAMTRLCKSAFIRGCMPKRSQG
eukprot:3880258-Pleurochrysis_carterae.AAC.2